MVGRTKGVKGAFPLASQPLARRSRESAGGALGDAGRAILWPPFRSISARGLRSNRGDDDGKRVTSNCTYPPARVKRVGGFTERKT